MKKYYYTIARNGFVSCRHFDFEEDAIYACQMMNMFSPGWKVVKILCA